MRLQCCHDLGLGMGTITPLMHDWVEGMLVAASFRNVQNCNILSIFLVIWSRLILSSGEHSEPIVTSASVKEYLWVHFIAWSLHFLEWFGIQVDWRCVVAVTFWGLVVCPIKCCRVCDWWSDKSCVLSSFQGMSTVVTKGYCSFCSHCNLNF